MKLPSLHTPRIARRFDGHLEVPTGMLPPDDWWTGPFQPNQASRR